MTNHGNRRGLMRYDVSHPDHKTRPPFVISLARSRERDVLETLIRAGAAGASFYDLPAPRWASAIHRLRRRGVDIATAREPHGGTYPGSHARYYLLSKVARIPEGGAK